MATTDIPKFGDWVSMHIIPLVYDDSLSYLEMLGAMKLKVNDVIDLYNDIDGKVSTLMAWIDAHLNTYATDQLTGYLTDGTFAALINGTLWDGVHADIDGQVATVIANNTATVASVVADNDASVAAVVADNEASVAAVIAEHGTLTTAINNAVRPLANSGSVIEFGADPTKTTNSYAAFITAMQTYETVIIPTGEYRIDQPLIILPTYKVRHIIGTSRDTSLLFFTTEGIVNRKSGLNVSEIGVFGNFVGSGVGVEITTHCKNMQIYNFSVGLDLARGVHVVTATFERLTIAYNTHYGVKAIAGNNSQNNGITFKELYIVKNGADADNLTSNALIGDGDGMYVNGGYGILIENTVFEYNAGILYANTGEYFESINSLISSVLVVVFISIASSALSTLKQFSAIRIPAAFTIIPSIT